MEGSFWQGFYYSFFTVFMAELGDKTQLLTMKLQATYKSGLAIFSGAAAALILSSFLAVVFGDFVHRFFPETWINIIFGLFFVVIGLLMITGRF